ncbi:MAG: hypothetical protein RLN76_13150 [Phycisphaeraceae bacterium]
MQKLIQFTARWLIAVTLVAVPLSYILWQWRHAEHKELASFSYEAFSQRMTDTTEPVYWPYGIWVIGLVAIVVLTVNLVARGLKTVFPNPKPKHG